MTIEALQSLHWKYIKRVTSSTIEKMLKKKIIELSQAELRRTDEEGARFYLLTDHEGQPYLHISFGNPTDRAMHEWADSQSSPRARDYGWECWQEERTPPKFLRQLLHDRLPDTLIEEYLRACLQDSSENQPLRSNPIAPEPRKSALLQV